MTTYPLVIALEELDAAADYRSMEDHELWVNLEEAKEIVERLETKLLLYWEQQKLNNKCNY